MFFLILLDTNKLRGVLILFWADQMYLFVDYVTSMVSFLTPIVKSQFTNWAEGSWQQPTNSRPPAARCQIDQWRNRRLSSHFAAFNLSLVDSPNNGWTYFHTHLARGGGRLSPDQLNYCSVN